MLRTRELVQPDIEKKKVRFETEFEDGLPELFVNKNQLLEMFLNLYMNAIDAMQDGGTLTIGAKSSTLNGRPAVAAIVSDTGCGIKKEHLSRIFDRYHTTKETGTGLGLAVVERIASAHNGKVAVDSTVNNGTTFTITLPA
jgi:two-component system sensor histidine kinase HydH